MSRSNHQNQSVRTITDRNKRLGFGRYADETVQDIIDNIPSYILWLDENTDIEIASDILAEADEKNSPNHEFKNYTLRDEPSGGKNYG